MLEAVFANNNGANSENLCRMCLNLFKLLKLLFNYLRLLHRKEQLRLLDPVVGRDVVFVVFVVFSASRVIGRK